MKLYCGKLRAALLAAGGNVSLYVFACFIVGGVTSMAPLDVHREAFVLLNQYLLVPWGGALCLLYLERGAKRTPAPKRDVQLLFVLLVWIIVPFALRFGVTFNNAGAWYNHAVVYFGIYAFLREKPQEEREALLDLLSRLCCALAIVLGGALLLCAAFALSLFGGAYPFGVSYDAGQATYHLAHGMHYNLTGMVCLCLMMFCLCGFERAGRKPERAAHLCGAGVMAAVIVLTQSRTARYAMIIALAAGAFARMQRLLAARGARVRFGAAALAGVIAAVGAYTACAGLTDAALTHFEQTEMKAQGESSAAQMLGGLGLQAELPHHEKTPQDAPAEARAAVDATFSDRTKIWANLFELWRDDPWHLFIGNGIGRTGSRIVRGTIHEQAGAVQVHNTYLQHTADFGLVGSALLLSFFLMILRPAGRVFFSAGAAYRPGYTPLCMLALACLATGMMESAPLGAMTAMNLMLFFALALIASRGETPAALVKGERDMI